jgi:hypothetical protein
MGLIGNDRERETAANADPEGEETEAGFWKQKNTEK